MNVSRYLDSNNGLLKYPSVLDCCMFAALVVVVVGNVKNLVSQLWINKPLNQSIIITLSLSCRTHALSIAESPHRWTMSQHNTTQQKQNEYRGKNQMEMLEMEMERKQTRIHIHNFYMSKLKCKRKKPQQIPI